MILYQWQLYYISFFLTEDITLLQIFEEYASEIQNRTRKCVPWIGIDK